MKNKFNKISVIGLGYIGLPTAAVFASRKIKVTGVDVNKNAVDTINKGEIHIVEPQLDIVVRAAVSEGYLKASLEPESADAFIVAVPTPFDDNHKPDLSYIFSASEAIAPHLEKGNLVVLESTSPVGATDAMSKFLAKCRPDLTFPHEKGNHSDVRIAHCPERVLPGHVLRELVQNDRVIGGISDNCTTAAIDLYQIFVSGECVATNARTAEMCKLTENACRDVQIAFANELSMICDKHQINVWELITLANRHPRINILQPGPGVGGHCIAVDPWFIVSEDPELSNLIRTAREVNDSKPGWVENKVLYLAQSLKKEKVKVACLGLSFKADIDDLRESPALQIALNLNRQESLDLCAVEPNIEFDDRSVKDLVIYDLNDALAFAEIVLILVDHKEFYSLREREEIKDKLVVDTRGLLNSEL